MKESKDSAENAKAIFKADSAIIQVGDTVRFGSYQQDNNKSNGKEDIEWIVLAKDGDKVLIISKYALDCQKFNTYNKDVTWETCTLRKWLNGTFYNATFNSAEQGMIATTTVTVGKNTTDKVFLLSIKEVNKYFLSDSARDTIATKYAIAQGAWTDENVKCCWWLCFPPSYANEAAFVRSGGSVNWYGCPVNSDDVAVRPALWINLGF